MIYKKVTQHKMAVVKGVLMPISVIYQNIFLCVKMSLFKNYLMKFQYLGIFVKK